MNRWVFSAAAVVTIVVLGVALIMESVSLARAVTFCEHDPSAVVYEYASNRLCRISGAECERLARVILKAENDTRSQSTSGNSR